MVFIPKGSQVFDQLPDEFQSFFPSEQSLADGKLASILERSGGSTGADLMTQIQAKSVTQGLQLVLREKAIYAGDFLSEKMPEIVTFTSDNFGLKVPQGLFASVPFPATILEDPLLNAMAGVGMKLALDAVSAIPVAGKIIALIVNIGLALAKLFGAGEKDPEVPPLLLPWTKYQRDPDEDLVNKGLMTTASKVDWTTIWLPGLGGTWSFERAADAQGKEMPSARVYAALAGKSVGWSKGTGFGALPNTLRVAGPVQTTPDPRAEAAGMEKFIVRGKDREDAEGLGVFTQLYRPPTVIDTGAFFPAFAGIAGQLWQQVQQRGNPDMFKVSALKVRDAWQDYWGAFFDDAFGLIKQMGNKKGASDDQIRWLWAALTPYICVIQQNGKSITLGMRNIHRVHPGPLVTPNIFTNGPGDPRYNTAGLYSVVEGGKWDGTQLQGTGDMAVISWDDQIISPSRASGKHPLDSKIIVRAVPWPAGEERMSYYQPPDKAIITPACDALRRAQLRCLESTLVCAYVRPDAAKGKHGEILPAYAAFVGDDELRNRCRDVRELLLKHDARFDVSLADVDAVDPAFAARLRAAGAGKVQGGLKLKASGKPLVETPSGKDEPPIAPAEGLAFDSVRRPDRVGRGPSRLAKGLAIAGGLAVAGAAGTALMIRRNT
jgi:hypothetical protein